MTFFSKFFNQGESSALGVDIGSSAIKIVQIKKKNGQAVLETYGELALGPYVGVGVGQAVILTTDKIAQALTDLMREKEVNITTKKCGISIPFASSLMSVIEMPAVSSKQLAVMVPLEARRYIPVPISEVMLDWSVIPKSEVEEEDSSEYAATEERSPVVREAGAPATLAKVSVLIMAMGAASTKLYVVERGVIRSSHTINRGSQDITSTISKSLGLSLERAEIMKRQVGAAGKDKNLT